MNAKKIREAQVTFLAMSLTNGTDWEDLSSFQKGQARKDAAVILDILIALQYVKKIDPDALLTLGRAEPDDLKAIAQEMLDRIEEARINATTKAMERAILHYDKLPLDKP